MPISQKTLEHLSYLLCLILAIICFSFCYAAPIEVKPYYQHHSEGWHWYHEHILVAKPKKTIKEKQSAPTSIPSPSTNPNQAMHHWQQQIKTALNLAILEPTVAHVQHYMQLQQHVSRQATLFTRAWQQALLTYPQLSHELEYPSTQMGQQVYWQQKEDKQQQVLKALSKSAGLFFFYHSGCHYCQRFAPILKDFSAQTGIKVIAITLDGKTLPEFPKSRVNPEMVKKLHITVTPTLYLAYPKSGKLIPVGHGLMSQSMLAERLVMLNHTQTQRQPHV